MRPKITYRNTDIAYKSATKFLGIYITENLKWTTDICILRLQLSKVYYIIKLVQGIIGLGTTRSFYHSKFESLIRYAIIFWVGGGAADNESIPIFKLKKRMIGSECGAGRGTSCGQLFKDCKILTVTSLYVLKCQVFLKKYKSAVQKLNSYMIIIKGQIWIYIPNLVIKISIKNVINMGIR